MIAPALKHLDVVFALPLRRSCLRDPRDGRGREAAVLPARRASRLNVLKALHYE